MPRPAKLAREKAIPVLEQYRGVEHETVSVGASVVAIPTTNMSYRKSILIQNNHASQILYVGGGLPDFFIGNASETEGNKFNLQWKLSGSGTNEWYAVSSTDGDPGLTETKIMYYAEVGGAETLATNGTVGSLSEHQWDWGDNDTLGFNTFYIATDGALLSNAPNKNYESIVSYNFTLTADEAATGGIQIAPGGSLNVNLDGSVRLFGIASGASTPIAVLETI